MQTCKRDTFFIAIVTAISFAWITTAKGENTNLLKVLFFSFLQKSNFFVFAVIALISSFILIFHLYVLTNNNCY